MLESIKNHNKRYYEKSANSGSCSTFSFRVYLFFQTQFWLIDSYKRKSNFFIKQIS